MLHVRVVSCLRFKFGVVVSYYIIVFIDVLNFLVYDWQVAFAVLGVVMFYCSQDGILKYESSLVDFCYDLFWDLACSTSHHILILARARPRPVHLYNICVISVGESLGFSVQANVPISGSLWFIISSSIIIVFRNTCNCLCFLYKNEIRLFIFGVLLELESLCLCQNSNVSFPSFLEYCR